MNVLTLDDHFERWNELLDLIVRSFAYMNGRIDPPSSALALTAASLAVKARNEIGHVILDGDKLIGCVFCRLEPDCLYIGKLAVLPERQGAGIGRQLLSLAEETARAADVTTLRLETRIELTGNHATFSAWGFRKSAENAHPGFSRITSIEMRKTLEPDSKSNS